MEIKYRNVYYQSNIYTNVIGVFRTDILHTLDSIPVAGSHSFTDGQEVVEGKDYEKGYQWQTDFKNKGRRWEDCTQAVYSMAHVSLRRIVATQLFDESTTSTDTGQQYELKYCETCIQMTNHQQCICLKCKTTAHTEELSTPPVREVKSAEEVLENMYQSFKGTRYTCEWWDDFKDLDSDVKECAIAAMEEYASQFTPHKEGYSVEGWVRVEDGLPEVEEHVIIKCTNHRVCTTGYIHERGYWIISNGNGSTYKQNDMHTITHWQPLPQPPTKKHT